MNSHFWDGQWREGSGDPLRSTDPAHGTLLWEGQAATAADVDAAVGAAREAAPAWGRRPLDARIALAEAFAAAVKADSERLARLLAADLAERSAPYTLRPPNQWPLNPRPMTAHS